MVLNGVVASKLDSFKCPVADLISDGEYPSEVSVSVKSFHKLKELDEDVKVGWSFNSFATLCLRATQICSAFLVPIPLIELSTLTFSSIIACKKAVGSK